MHPLLLPALRRLWRDRTTLQLGIDPARAVVLDNVDAATVTVLGLLDGQHSVGEIATRAGADGIPPARVSDLLGLLARCGAVVDGEPAAGLPRRLPADARRRIGPDLAALSLTRGVDAGAVLARRGRCAVVVHARGRIGPVVAALLGAAGVGRVHVQATGLVTAGDACPGGLLPSDEHRAYAVAAADAVRRAAPEVDTRPIGPRRLPDLVVLAAGHAPAPRSRRATAVLPVGLRDGTAVIGPMTVPGRTACLDCVELHRRDRDPAWPAISAQLSTSRPAQPEPSQLALAASAAGIAAAHVLSHLDGGEPETLGRSLDLTGLGERIRRRSWEPHPRCPCVRTPSPV